jgi:hypothetical protein
MKKGCPHGGLLSNTFAEYQQVAEGMKWSKKSFQQGGYSAKRCWVYLGERLR